MIDQTPQYPDALALALNTDMAITAQGLAHPDHWQALGSDDYRLWGICDDDDVNVALYRHLPQHGFYCTCRREKRCQHIVALYLLLIDHAAAFDSNATPPEYVTFGLAHPYDDMPGDRRPHIEEGLTQLDTWLTTLVHHGLGEPHVRTPQFWQDMAERLSAAYLPSLAQMLREVPSLINEGDAWVEPVMHRLGWLYLLIRSVERFDAHPLPTQADLRAALDWHLTPEEIDAEPLRDTWQIIGRQQRVLNAEVPELRVWLYGKTSGRIAELRSVGFRQALPTFWVEPGYSYDATVLYEPTQGSQRAHLLATHSEPAFDVSWQGRSMHASVEAFSQKLSVNPWLRHDALILDAVYPTRFDAHWTLRYADGHYLPLAPDFQHKWVLYALSSGNPIQVVALWDGQYLHPLTARHDDHIVDMQTLLDYV